MVKERPKEREQVVATHRQASFQYFIEDRLEAGIALLGPEVKSLREGRANLKESFARIEGEEVYLYDCHISPYAPGSRENPDPTRPRKLLLKKEEIRRLIGKTQQKGLTLIPLRIYFNPRGIAKVELALARGKKLYDKRETEARRSAQREIDKAVREKRR